MSYPRCLIANDVAVLCCDGRDQDRAIISIAVTALDLMQPRENSNSCNQFRWQHPAIPVMQDC